MPTPETQSLPDWAKRERLSDLAWIRENWHVLWPAAQHGLEESGRGALVVDTTTLVVNPDGKGHPFAYLPQGAVDGSADEDAIRLVREYEPKEELVVVLLKLHGHESVYRVKLIEETR